MRGMSAACMAAMKRVAGVWLSEWLLVWVWLCVAVAMTVVVSIFCCEGIRFFEPVTETETDGDYGTTLQPNPKIHFFCLSVEG